MQGVRVDSDYPIQSAKEREEKKKLRATLSSPHIHTHLVLMFCFWLRGLPLCFYCAWAGPASHSLFWRSAPSWITRESNFFFLFSQRPLSRGEIRIRPKSSQSYGG